jgi:Flp pilus assembly protein TadD
LNNLAWIYGERGDPRALELAKRARDALPSDPSIADTLGWLHVRGGDVEAGLPLLAEAATAMPADGEIRYHLAFALAEAGDRDQAVTLLAALVDGDVDFPSRQAARDLLGRLRERGR